MNPGKHEFVYRSDHNLCSDCGEDHNEYVENLLVDGLKYRIEHKSDVAPLEFRDLTPENAADKMERALKTYQERNATYGNSYHKFGAVMMALFPNGLCIRTFEDFNRYGVLFMKISKLIRYTTDPHRGHLDSVHDDGVYSFILEELDALYEPNPSGYSVVSSCQHVWSSEIMRNDKMDRQCRNQNCRAWLNDFVVDQ